MSLVSDSLFLKIDTSSSGALLQWTTFPSSHLARVNYSRFILSSKHHDKQMGLLDYLDVDSSPLLLQYCHKSITNA